MPLRILSVAPPFVSLLFFSAFVVARVNVTANCTSLSFSWTFNSLGQSPCTVAGYMLATCFAGSYTIEQLPDGYVYLGAGQNSSNTCECSTVGYSLLTACAACQEGEHLRWSEYIYNCTTILPPAHFPNPVPAGIRVPYWALLDVTTKNNWNSSEAFTVRDNPEYGPGVILGSSSDCKCTSCESTSSESTSSESTSSACTSSTSMSPTSTSSTCTSSESMSSATTFFQSTFLPSTTSTASPTPLRSAASVSHAGGIVGGVLGCISLISLFLVSIFYRRRTLARPSADADASQPMLNDRPLAVAQLSLRPLPTMRLYDPNDPTTFPGHQGSSRSLNISSTSQVTSPLPPHVRSGSEQADPMEASLARAWGYRGLPMPSS